MLFKTTTLRNIIFRFVLFFTLVTETLIVERKYAIFGGGFLSSQTIDTVPEIILFSIVLIMTQMVLLYGLYRLFKWINRSNLVVAYYNFAFCAASLHIIVLGLKFKLLEYFSDAVGFQLIAKLGGGSLSDALIYAMDEGAFALGFLCVAVIIYLVGLKLVKKINVQKQSAPVLSKGMLLFFLISIPALILISNSQKDVRFGLNKFISFNMINSTLSLISDFDGDGYSYFSQHIDGYPFDGQKYPFALDIPNNGIDEDGLNGDFIFVDDAKETKVLTAHNGKNIVLIVLESGRADMIGKKINGTLVAPNITNMAYEGSFSKHAYSHVGYTSPSLKTLFTGELHPNPSMDSLFSVLKNIGYQNAVISG